jgi:hypothetical protein
MEKKRILLLSLITTLLILASAHITVLSSSTTRIVVSPSITNKGLGESFTVDVEIIDAEDPVYSYQMNMSFNSDVLTFVNVTEGDFLAEQPEGTYAPSQKIGTSSIFIGWCTIGKFNGVTGTGTLATVEFEVKAVGECPLKVNHTTTKLFQVFHPPVPPGQEPVRELPYVAENGLFMNTVDPPNADFTYSPSFPVMNEQITFDASASSAAEPNVITEYHWDFGDGTQQVYVRGVNLTDTATHTYTASGIYETTLTVIDNASASDLVQNMYNTTTMPQIWYDLYSTKTAGINIKFGNDIAVTTVTRSPTTVTVGETVTVSVTVINKGAETVSFDVTAYYGNTEIDTQQVTDFEPEDEETLTFEWDTTDVAPGAYQISAEATVEDEGYPADNDFTDGDVTVNPVGGEFPTTIVIAAVVVIVVIVAAVFLLMRRRG